MRIKRIVANEQRNQRDAPCDGGWAGDCPPRRPDTQPINCLLGLVQMTVNHTALNWERHFGQVLNNNNEIMRAQMQI